MSRCIDSNGNALAYCSTGFGTYIAVGVILPIGLLVLTILVTAYLRYRRRQSTREQQQISMSTVVPIDNTEGEVQPIPYDYSYPPNYTSTFTNIYDKPPSYEQTVEYLSSVNNTSEGPAVLPVTTTAQHFNPSRNPT